MSLKFYVDKAGNRVYVQSAQYFEVDVFVNITLLFPTSVAITADIAESQTKQIEAIVSKETYNAALSESQVKQTESISSSEAYLSSLAEIQAVQTEAIQAKAFAAQITESQGSQSDSIVAKETYKASISESQSIQSEAVSGTVASTGITASIVESQAQQSESLSGMVANPVSAIIQESQSLQVESIVASVPVIPPPPSPPPRIQSGGGGTTKGFPTSWTRPIQRKKRKVKKPQVITPPARLPPIKPRRPIVLDQIFPNLSAVRAKTISSSPSHLEEIKQKIRNIPTGRTIYYRDPDEEKKVRDEEEALLLL